LRLRNETEIPVHKWICSEIDELGRRESGNSEMLFAVKNCEGRRCRGCVSCQFHIPDILGIQPILWASDR